MLNKSNRNVVEPILPLETETERINRLRIQSRRDRAEERKEHFLQPTTLKHPVLGTEIDKQLAEKEIKRQAEIIAEQKYVEETKKLQAQMAKLELERELDRKERLEQLRQSQQIQILSKREEEKMEPIRRSDYDQTLGISSGQIFQGEDLHKPERRRLQQLQMRQWVQAQREIDEEKRRKEYEEEMEYARSVERNIALGKQLEMERAKYDHQKYMETLNSNKLIDIQKKERELKESEYLKDFPPLENASSMSFIRQETTHPHPAEYRGMSEKDLEQIKEQQIVQIRENEEKREKERQFEREWVEKFEENQQYANQQAYLDELDRFNHNQQIKAYNDNLKKLKIDRDRKEREYLSGTRPNEDFFQYFGRMER